MKYERLSKKAMGCMYTASAIVDVIVFVGAVILWNRVIPHKWLWENVIYGAILVMCVLDLSIVPYIRYCRYRYCITDECIDVKEGFLFIARDIVPIERLHKIRTVRGPIDRIFGLTKVIVTTAGGDVTIRFLEEEQADRIAESLQKRVNEIVVTQREESEAAERTEKDAQEG